MSYFRFLCQVPALVLIVVGQAVAQTPTDAGTLQQQIDRERAIEIPKRIAPARPTMPAPMPTVGGVTVTVKSFHFAGNTLLTAEQLAPAVAKYLNRPLDFSQLQEAAAAVAEAYRAAGWIVRTYLPRQDIKDGSVIIQIVEAVFGKLRWEIAPHRVAAQRIEALFATAQPRGQHLDTAALDRALLLADDLPGVNVVGHLASGAGEHETDLILTAKDEPLVNGNAAFDNAGARSTGANRLTVGVTLNSPLGMGDLLSANAIHSRGSDYARLGFSVPVGTHGWRIGLSASSLDYRLLTFNPDTDKGTSSTTGLEASYPVVRSRLANLHFNLNVDHKAFDNQFLAATTSRYSTDVSSVALNGNFFDNLGGGGANNASLTWVSGSRNNEIGTTDQHYGKLFYSLSRQQVVTDTVSLFAALSGQEGESNLDTSEKFYLGGMSGVRAYPASEAGGDSGVLANLELRWRLASGFMATAFHDYGEVRNTGSPSYHLKGVGLSLGWQGESGNAIKATWGRRLGSNPNPTSTGQDQDGTLVKDRFWLMASLPF